jgi:putative lipoprotein
MGRTSVLLLIGLGLLSACAQTPPASVELRLTATLPERAPLPADAVVELRAEDVARAGAPARLLAEQRRPAAGGPPFALQLRLPLAALQPPAQVRLRTRVLQGEQLLYTSDTATPVRAEAGEQRFAQALVRVAVADAPLQNSYWKLVALDGQAVSASGRGEPFFTLHLDDARISGSDGCNRFTGRYVLESGLLRIGPVAGTLMACAEGEATSRAFTELLRQPLRWRIQGEVLELFDERGQPRARLQRRLM